ncbi:CsbD family protein [Streptomyces sp. TRM 70361]|uniref:CsbD family protein n=1 Tax=Streptomyces sp. TRM 70361 TaxID=3116553 RepID=UPI002E7AE7A8|nr:CsbD family protein [Streptomyces sp. TRM 70361]MEE1938902.1 CsbD family protein [Streptomyces sp. TRM 70361]
MSESPNLSNGPARQTGQTAKQETRATADRAKEAAGTVAGSAREQAGHVTGEARHQVAGMAGQLKERATREADSQTRRTADTIRQWADDLSGMAENTRSDSPVRSLVSQAADGGRRAADLLEDRGAGGLVEGLESFARRRPGAFLAGAAVAGFAVGRLAKAGKNVQQGSDGAGREHTAGRSEYTRDGYPSAPGEPVTTGGGDVRPMPGYGEPGYGSAGAYGTGTYGADAPRRPEVG